MQGENYLIIYFEKINYIFKKQLKTNENYILLKFLYVLVYVWLGDVLAHMVSFEAEEQLFELTIGFM